MVLILNNVMFVSGVHEQTDIDHRCYVHGFILFALCRLHYTDAQTYTRLLLVQFYFE